MNAALTEHDGEGEMTRVPLEAMLLGAVPVWTVGLGSFVPERNALGGVGCHADLRDAIAGHRRQERVQCLTLATLRRQHDLPRIDLLQVDAEGYELEILRQVLEAGYRPRVLHLEHWALPPAEHSALLSLLNKASYHLFMSESDVLAVEPDLAATLDVQKGCEARA